MNMKIQLVSLLESCMEIVEKVNQQLTPNNELIAETVFILGKVIKEVKLKNQDKDIFLEIYKTGVLVAEL